MRESKRFFILIIIITTCGAAAAKGDKFLDDLQDFREKGHKEIRAASSLEARLNAFIKYRKSLSERATKYEKKVSKKSGDVYTENILLLEDMSMALDEINVKGFEPSQCERKANVIRYRWIGPFAAPPPDGVNSPPMDSPPDKVDTGKVNDDNLPESKVREDQAATSGNSGVDAESGQVQESKVIPIPAAEALEVLEILCGQEKNQ